MKLLPSHLASTKQRNSEGAQRGAHCCRNSNIVLILDIFFLQLKSTFYYHQSCHWLGKTKYSFNKSTVLSVFFFLNTCTIF